ncbi:MAG TPA: tetratricopeptide repeat protein [Terriglobales bacterium]|nr:tetratricopeptide repeat protein [Terriglobales bacterium]
MRTPTLVRAKLWLPAALVGLAFTLPLPGTARADDVRDGRAALQAGRLDEAMRHFEQAASQGNAEGRAGVGLVYLKRHQLAKAMDAFQMAEKMDTQLPTAYYGEGEVLRQQDKCDQAIPKFQRAVELDRRYPEAELGLTDCLMKVKRFADAIKEANRGLGWGAKWRPLFLITLGNIASARDSLRDAAIWYTTAVQESPENPATHRALGGFYVKRGTFELAYPELEAAVAQDSTDVDLHYALGQALYYGQRYTRALEEYQWVVAHDPEYPEGQFALGDLLYRSGKADSRRYQEARAPLEKYVQLMPDDPKGWSVLGRDYYYLALAEKDSTLSDAALDALNKAERLGDKSKEMYVVRARLQIDRRQYDQAAADYDRAGTDLAPEDQYRLARIMAIQRNPARAESLYAAIVSQDSTTRLAGVVLVELGKMRFSQAADTARVDKQAAAPLFDQAIAMFHQRIRLDPNSDEAYYYVGLSCRQLDRVPEAIAAMRQARDLAPDKADRHFWLGLLYVQTDSTAEAEAEFQKAVDLDPTNSANKAIALQRLGYFRLLRKEYGAAIERLEQSLAINGRDPASLLWLAQASQNSGNRAKATEYYRRLLEVDPNNKDARSGLKSLEGGAK